MFKVIMYVKLKLEMEQIIVNKPIVLENIYYDLDKLDIRDDGRRLKQGW